VPTPNRTLIQKADLALQDLVTGGGYLKPRQALKFMRLLVRESVLLKAVTFTPMQAPKEQISKIKFGQRVLRPGQDAVALAQADRSKPDLSAVELDAKLFKAEVHLPDGVLEDNIERGDLRQTIMELLSEAVARDMEELVIAGNTASTDPFLATMDGVLRQAQSHVVDAANQRLDGNLLADLLGVLPPEYRRDKKALRFFTSTDAELDYRRALTQRETAVGDRFLEEDAPVQYSGVPLIPVPLFPENLGTNANQSAVLLTSPANVVVGVWRQIRIETDRDISAGVLKVVVTLRFDCKLADELGTAKLGSVRAVI
jgi:HK97 family phage major capsid protein